MLFTRRFREGIATGAITVAFRRWRRPTVKAGGTLRLGGGILAIESVEPIEASDITDGDALAAGFSSAAEVHAADTRVDGRLYRIAFHLAGPDPRIALRENAEITNEEYASLTRRLASLDKRSPAGPWTSRVLQLIADHPERRAAELATLLGVEKDWLKPNVRKLKDLGLTESLEIGYRISPRGEAFMRRSAGR